MTASELSNFVWWSNKNGGSGKSARFKVGMQRPFSLCELSPVFMELGEPRYISRSRFSLSLFRGDAVSFALLGLCF